MVLYRHPPEGTQPGLGAPTHRAVSRYCACPRLSRVDLCAIFVLAYSPPCTLRPARVPLVEREAAVLGFPSRTIRSVRHTSVSRPLLTLASRVILLPPCRSVARRVPACDPPRLEELRAAGRRGDRSPSSRKRAQVSAWSRGAQPPPPKLPAARVDPWLRRGAPTCPLRAPSGLLDCLAGWLRSRPGCRVGASPPCGQGVPMFARAL